MEEGAKGYRVMAGGKLGRHPRLATEMRGIHRPEAVVEIVENWLDHYQRHCLKGVRFGEILEREGMNSLRE